MMNFKVKEIENVNNLNLNQNYSIKIFVVKTKALNQGMK